MLTQNNTAFTYAVHYDGAKESLRGIEETVYAPPTRPAKCRARGPDNRRGRRLRHPHRPRLRRLGRDRGGDKRATVGLLRGPYHDYTKAWLDDRRLDLQIGDGRHYLERHAGPTTCAALGVDSYSGTPGAAHVFSENYLYTQEASTCTTRGSLPRASST